MADRLVGPLRDGSGGGENVAPAPTALDTFARASLRVLKGFSDRAVGESSTDFWAGAGRESVPGFGRGVVARGVGDGGVTGFGALVTQRTVTDRSPRGPGGGFGRGRTKVIRSAISVA